jgi:chromosome segregation ATPase
MMNIRIYDRLTAQANAWARKAERAINKKSSSVGDLQSLCRESDEILSALRADCEALRQQKTALEFKVSRLDQEIEELREMPRARAREIQHIRLLASFLHAKGGYSIDHLVSELPKFFQARGTTEKVRGTSRAQVRALLGGPIT